MRCLDPSRLGNQVWREGLTIIRGGWRHHRVSRMWRGYEFSLGEYLLCGIQALMERGKLYIKIRDKIMTEMAKHPDTGPPPWVGRPEIHASHRSNLLRKRRAWYARFGWEEPDNLPYIWPV